MNIYKGSAFIINPAGIKKIFASVVSIVCCCLLQHAVAQDSLQQFGSVDLKDMQLAECPFDKAANAMYLIKAEKTTVSINADNGTPKITTEYRQRIKIFNKNGFRYANVVIPYAANSRVVKISDIDAFVYNLDGQGNITSQKLDRDQVFKEQSAAGKSYSSIRFTFPGVQSGSVIEYKYTRTEKGSFNIQPWFPQNELPVSLAKCAITIPAYLEILYHFVTAASVEKDSSGKTFSNSVYNEDKRLFTMRNLPGFKYEPFMASWRDNLQHVEFALTPKSHFVSSDDIDKRWLQLNNLLLEAPFFGLQFYTHIEGTEAFLDSVNSLKQDAGKINAAYEYVKNIIKWNGEQTFFAGSLDECFKTRSGSSGEMNIMLVNLLKKMGIQCYPVLVSTRENGKLDKSFANLAQFNSVDVLAVDKDKVYILDCTQKDLSFKTTPFNIVNLDAFVIDREFSRWVTVSDKRHLINVMLNVNAGVDSTGLMKGTGEMIYTGIAKAEAIEQEKQTKGNMIENARGFVDNDASTLQIDSSSTLHRDDDNDSLIRKFVFHDELSSAGDIYFINPFMFFMFKKNPFTDSARYADIDFGSNQSYTTNIHIKLPGNFSVDQVPVPVFLYTEDSAIVFTKEFSSSADELIIRNSFIVNKSYFGKEEYGDLKLFFNKMYALINKELILNRKK